MEDRRQTSLSQPHESTACQEPPDNFPASLGAGLLIEISKLDLRLKSVLVGFEKNSFLLVKLFPDDLVGTFRSESVLKSPIIVKFRHRGAVYGFDTEILNIVSNPCRLMFIGFPKKIEEFKVSPDLRRECVLPAMIMLNNEIIDMVIVDMSRQGCQCVIETSGTKGETLQELMHINTVLELLVHFPETRERLKLAGRVRNIGNDLGKISIGMMFEGLSPETSAKIEGFITK